MVKAGRFVEAAFAGERVRAFVPPPLPPTPPVDIARLIGRLSVAEREVGRLDGAAALLPDDDLFLSMYVRKEAVLSSQIEGTQSTSTDLLRFEAEARAGAVSDQLESHSRFQPDGTALDSELERIRQRRRRSGQPIDDGREVSNYVSAMRYGLDRLRGDPPFPLSLRLVREMHAHLLRSGRGGGTEDPGEFRRSQNWIGGTRPGNALFVPPPVPEMTACLDALERFIHEDELACRRSSRPAADPMPRRVVGPFEIGLG